MHSSIYEKSAILFLILVNVLSPIYAKIHHLDLKGDSRRYFPISTFGFYRSGYLSVDVSKFKIQPVLDPNELFGFSLEKTANPYTDNHPETCALSHLEMDDPMVQRVLFTINPQLQRVTVRCSKDMQYLHIYEDLRQAIKQANRSHSSSKLADSNLFKTHTGEKYVPSRRRRAAVPLNESSEDTGKVSAEVTAVPSELSPTSPSKDSPQRTIIPAVKCEDVLLPLTYKQGLYNFSFVIFVANEKEEGLYNLNFHNCRNFDPTKPRSSIDMTLLVKELNPDDNYLSAGEMPLPALYFMMSLLFMLSAVFWFFLLRKNKDIGGQGQPKVFKIHYLMGLLVVIKSLSLLFHAINYHFIQIQGVHMEAWAVMYYIMHLLKGALLFTVLALIGSGWAFIKHILSSKEKKVFMIVIPLQIIANVATIIIEETDEWNPEQQIWERLLFLIDFLCCAAILLPVVWSIRHLQEASRTDGKAAMNLSKLKLFRHFYIMVVCYIYFTRIIVYLLRITVPFQYEWLDDMCREMATYVFFVVTGYKFRPAVNNPYLLLADDDDDDEDIVLTTTGLNENISRVNMGGSKKVNQQSSLREETVCQDDSEVNFLLKEDSHDLD